MAERKSGFGLSAFALKIIALLLMTADHTGHFLPGTPLWLRMAGRLAAPVFFYVMSWSMRYTGSRPRFILRLYLMVPVMELTRLAASLVSPELYYFINNNIFATFCYAALFVTGADGVREAVYEKDRSKALKYGAMLLLPLLWELISPAVFSAMGQNAARVLGALLPPLSAAEGGIAAVLLGIGFYYFGETRASVSGFYLCYCGLVLFSAVRMSGWGALFTADIQWMMVFALPLLLLYNHKKGAGMKWLFYIYYPAHILILSVIGWRLSR